MPTFAKTMIKPKVSNVLLLVVVVVLALVCAELTIRTQIKPCADCYGTFLAFHLPPLSIVSVPANSSADNKTLNNRAAGSADLMGPFRSDDVLGYASKENTVSSGGLWKTNNIGARAAIDTQRKVALGKKRMLISGDSYSAGFGLPYEKTWAFLLAQNDPVWDVVNLSVSGYSLGQSFKKWAIVTSEFEYDVVLFSVNPSETLWREVNCLRRLARPAWKDAKIFPRYIMKKSTLQFVPAPLRNSGKGFDPTTGVLTTHGRNFLRTYDRFYIPVAYEKIPFIGRSVIFKLAAARYIQLRKKILMENFLDVRSEARQVMSGILEELYVQTSRAGKQAFVVYLPGNKDVTMFGRNEAFRQRWQEMVDLTPKGIIAIDLMPTLLGIKNRIDVSSDGSHYGPVVNEVIAEEVGRRLQQKNPAKIGVIL